MALLDWLLDSDPALRWQVERDLAGAPPSIWQATRARTASEGFGARLLALQDSDGQWAGGSYFPAGFFDAEHPDGEGQPWTATTWSLNSLRDWGVPAEALGDTAERLRRNCRWDYDGLPYWNGEIDICINAMTLATGTWLGVDMSHLAAWFTSHQLDDGGWNCEAEEGNSTRSSFHSTLNAVIGLLDYEERTGDATHRPSRHRGEEYLLSRRLLHRASTGELVGPFALHFRSPRRYAYSALEALDHLRRAAHLEGTAPDPRAAEAIAAVREARTSEGTWLQGPPLVGAAWFPTDVEEGEPSKWLTLQGTRVLAWWDAAHPPSASD